MDFWTWVKNVYGAEREAELRKAIQPSSLAERLWYGRGADQPLVLENLPEYQQYQEYLKSPEYAAWVSYKSPTVEERVPIEAEREKNIKEALDKLTGTTPPPTTGGTTPTGEPITKVVGGVTWYWDDSTTPPSWQPLPPSYTEKAAKITMAGETPNYSKVGETRPKPDGSGVVQTYGIRLIEGNYVGIWEDTGFDETQSLEYKYKQASEESSKKDREERQRQFDAQMAWYQQSAAQEAQWRQQEQANQLAAQKQERLAQLAAQPQAWLQHAGLSGQTPSIQPWMLPLASQQYGWQAGQALPGWQPPTAESAQPMTSLPELTTPSMQYYARMGTTGQQQYQGYQQARTAATPEETQFRLWSMAPPSGQNRGLSYLR